MRRRSDPSSSKCTSTMPPPCTATTVPSPRVACSTLSPGREVLLHDGLVETGALLEAGERAAGGAVDIAMPASGATTAAGRLTSRAPRRHPPSGRRYPSRPVPGPGRSPTRPPTACLLDEAAGDLLQEARRHVVLSGTPQRARSSVHQVQTVHGPRDAHIGQPALLFHVLLVQGPLMREDALLHAADEHHGELEPLGVVQGHEREQRARVGDRVDVRVERDLLQEAGETRLLGALVVLRGHADELLEVLEPPLGLQGPLALKQPPGSRSPPGRRARPRPPGARTGRRAGLR